MYRVVPMAPVESDGATVVSRCPAQFRTIAGASTVAGAGGEGPPPPRAAAALAAAFLAAYTAGTSNPSRSPPRTPDGPPSLVRGGRRRLRTRPGPARAARPGALP